MKRAVWCLAVVGVWLVGCAGPALRARTERVSDQILQARAQGAMRCAPVPLAKAEAHRDFALQELSEGNHRSAKKQVALAESNAQAALEGSPADRCGEAKAPPAPGDGDGDGILDTDDECPDAAEDLDAFEDGDGCPELDNDGDGVLDTDDKCPAEGEDKDGFEDGDGCPELDNDGDGLADSVDGCPLDKEDVDGFEDDDGCPDCDNDKDGIPECPEARDACPTEGGVEPDGCPQKYTMIVVTNTKIELKQTIYFDTNKATIQPKSFKLLDEVAQALADRPDIEVRIEGHTDSQANDKFNLKLSAARATSVRAYLASKGVAESRMVAEGFGESVPVADNRTKAGREANRRVEFVITKQ